MVDGTIGVTRAEIVAALGLAIGVFDDVDLDTTVTKLDTGEFRIALRNCDSSLEYALRNESVRHAWALRLKSFRGASVAIHDHKS
jgi:hypothetical protein